MKNLLFVLILCAVSISFADRIVYDTTMAAAEHSEIHEYEDRGSFGPYIEFGNIKMSNITYNYRVHDQKYNISIDNSYIYGASGTLPLTEWFDLFVMAGYQYLGVSHHPVNQEKALADYNAVVEEYIDAPYNESDIDGRHQIHTALFQFGFDFAYPLVASYNYEFMLKPYAFLGTVVGKTFFSDKTKFTSPILYGYTYGAGVRMAFHGVFISGGIKNRHEYFHTYFERKTSETKEGDEFMLDFDTYFQPFVTFGITLF